MASKTPFYNLDLPEYIDDADVDVLNKNTATIDAILNDKITNPTGGVPGKFLQVGQNGKPAWGSAASATAVVEATEAWLAEHFNGETFVIDDTLTVAGAAADAAQVGTRINLAEENVAAADRKLRELIDDQFLRSEPVNFFPQLESVTNGYYLSGGTTVASANYSYTNFIEVQGGETFVFGLVPAYGAASTPWFACPVGFELYNADHQFIMDMSPTTAFTFPVAAKYMRVNLATGAGVDIDRVNARAMLVKGYALPSTYTRGRPIQYYDYKGLFERVDTLEDEVHIVSVNKYDKSLQTPSTISPHYYFNGVPYSSTQFDTSYNCTAMFEIKPDTTYTIGIVPAHNNVVKPWDNAGGGIFFYNSSGTYISGSTNNTFTTPLNAKYARFNYAIISGINLSKLNGTCMLVEGTSLPETYSGYYDYYPEEKFQEIDDEIANLPVSTVNKVKYIIEENGNSITIIYKYSETQDMAICMKKKGGNNIFDFYFFGVVPNTNPAVADVIDGITYLQTTTTDWHAPFIVKAKNNADGDDTSNHTFTGGNHQYNNTESGSTATGRTTSLAFYADKRHVTSGSGGCSELMIVWTNQIQGYNTRKANGSGREILKEVHRVVFDGTKFDEYINLIPMEDIRMERWYAFQWVATPYTYVKYIGGTNRGEYDKTSSSNCGDNKCCHMQMYSSNHEILIDVDPTYDIGDHRYYAGTETIFYSSGIGKGYFFIIQDTDLDSGMTYALHGSYTFRKHL